MPKQSFLNKLKKEGKLTLAEPSEEICMSYLEKSENCLKAAKILLENKLYENSVSSSYYAMYNVLIALLFRTGIKCENHSASILLLKEIFHNDKLFKIISFAKEERIDKQYYVTSQKNVELTKDSAQDMIHRAEEFTIGLKLSIKSINHDMVQLIRKEFEKKY